MKRSPKPPESLVDLGLTGRLRLAKYGNSKWAAHEIVIVDEKGHIFAFCASDLSPYRPNDDFFSLGVTEARPDAVRVTPDSKTYKFLFDLVWSFANDPRYQFTKKQAQSLQDSMHLSDDEFQILISKPE